MPYGSEEHHRRSIRLPGYDYAKAGNYFVTITTQDRGPLFGNIADGEMCLNDAGRMVAEVWAILPERFPRVELDICIVMPNHFHRIITIVGASLVGAQPNVDIDDSDNASTTRAGTRPAPTDLGNVIGAFKSITTFQCIHRVKESG